MKSRALLCMLIVFIILAGLWIMGGTIFIIREIEVTDTSPEQSVIAAQTKEEIISKIDLKGKNILFNVNETKIKERIKAVNPTLKVQNIRTKFPNKVVIDISKRVPIYTDGEYCFDADMCIFKGALSGDIVNITDANIALKNPTMGNVAVGVTERDNRKIQQLKIVGSYFDSVAGWKISYNDDPSEVGASRLCLNLEISPQVKFVIKTQPGEDFAKLLAYTSSVCKNNKLTGELEAWYHSETAKIMIYVDGEVYYER